MNFPWIWLSWKTSGWQLKADLCWSLFTKALTHFKIIWKACWLAWYQSCWDFLLTQHRFFCTEVNSMLMEAILTDHIVLMRNPVWYSWGNYGTFPCCGTSGSLQAVEAASSRSPATSPLLSPHSAPAASLACNCSIWRSKLLSKGDGLYGQNFRNHTCFMRHLDF